MMVCCDGATSGLVVVAAVLVAVWWRRRTRLPADLPPGPTPTLILGNLGMFQDNHAAHVTTAALRDKYGDVIFMQLGYYNSIILNSYKATKEAFVTQAANFSDRPDMFAGRLMNQGNYGVVLSSGDIWRQLRRFSLRTMRDLGMGKARVEGIIMEESRSLIHVMTESCHGLTELKVLKTLLSNAVSNVICTILFGDRYSYDDAEFQYFIQRMDLLIEGGGFPDAGKELFIPWMMPIQFLKKRDSMMKKIRGSNEVKAFLMQKIEEHSETFDPQNPRDFMDHYLIMSKEAEKETSLWSKGNLFQVVMDLFIGGTETVYTTLQWCVVFMARYPEVQRKCRDEIISTIGPANQVKNSDQSQLPFTLSTLQEIQRLCNTLPFSVLHNTSEEVRLGGYTIPKDFLVMANLYAANMDPDEWENPEEFRPERWLTTDGKSVRNPEAFVPFSVGPRRCLGESLAKMELFVFFASLLQHQEFNVDDPGSVDTQRGHLGMTFAPLNFDLTVSAV